MNNCHRKALIHSNCWNVHFSLFSMIPRTSKARSKDNPVTTIWSPSPYPPKCLFLAENSKRQPYLGDLTGSHRVSRLTFLAPSLTPKLSPPRLESGFQWGGHWLASLRARNAPQLLSAETSAPLWRPPHREALTPSLATPTLTAHPGPAIPLVAASGRPCHSRPGALIGEGACHSQDGRARARSRPSGTTCCPKWETRYCGGRVLAAGSAASRTCSTGHSDKALHGGSRPPRLSSQSAEVRWASPVPPDAEPLGH